MPTIPIHPRNETRSTGLCIASLPEILRTPSGLAIVEIQGTVKFSHPTQDSQDGLKATSSYVGKLVFPYYDETKPTEDISWQKRVHLYVGKHQRLTGEVKKLANPIAILQRKTDTNGCDELEIAEIVHYKMLFAHRPEPVGESGDE